MDPLPRARYREICEASPDAILLVDADGRITYANARVADLFGYEPTELAGEPVERLVPEPDREVHVAHREAYLDDPQTRPMGADLDLAARHKDGSTVPVAISLSPVEGESGVEIIAVVRDVSEEKALRKTYRTIIEAVPDAVVIADAGTGEIVEANERAASLTGRDSGALVGAPLTVLHPSDEAERYRDLLARHVADGGAICRRFPDGSDVLVETAAGDRVPVEINARTFELGDRRLIAAVLRDVTTRSAYARRLGALHRATRDLMAADDRSRIVRLVADTADEILGFGCTVVRLVADGPDLRPAAVTDQARAEMGDRPNYPLDADAPPSRAYASGEVLCYDDVREVEDGYDRGSARSAMYLPIDGHGVISIVDTAVDAFDQFDVELASILAANAETALDRLAHERRLERQNERLERFAGVVSHDLRNPLNAATGWLEVARDDASAEALDRVADALDRMDAMIDETLAMARHGRTVDETEPVDVSRLAEDCWETVPTADGRLEVVDAFRIRADRERLRHVFENLFRNAVEHGSTGGRPAAGDSVEHGSTGSRSRTGDSVEHGSTGSRSRTDDSVERGSTGSRVEPGDSVEHSSTGSRADPGDGGVTVSVGALPDGFYVADDGSGFDEDDPASLFEAGRTTDPSGTGLGLTIVREVVEAHGWDVRATEGANGGARFEITGVEFVA